MKKIVASVLLLLIVGAGSWYGLTKMFDRSDSLLSTDQVSQMIQQKYGGTIDTIRLEQSNGRQDYQLLLKKDSFSYEITVNGQTGDVLSLTKHKNVEYKKEHNKKEQTTHSNKNNPSQTATIPITEAKAKKLALEKVNGTITSIELDDEDDQLVYEVDINQSQKKKATVIINAYSGKIESITFETEDDD
jgi:uncharacterized membrane protein YkoI